MHQCDELFAGSRRYIGGLSFTFRSSFRIMDCLTNSGRVTGGLLVTPLGLETFFTQDKDDQAWEKRRTAPNWPILAHVVWTKQGRLAF